MAIKMKLIECKNGRYVFRFDAQDIVDRYGDNYDSNDYEHHGKDKVFEMMVDDMLDEIFTDFECYGGAKYKVINNTAKITITSEKQTWDYPGSFEVEADGDVDVEAIFGANN